MVVHFESQQLAKPAQDLTAPSKDFSPSRGTCFSVRTTSLFFQRSNFHRVPHPSPLLLRRGWARVNPHWPWPSGSSWHPPLAADDSPPPTNRTQQSQSLQRSLRR